MTHTSPVKPVVLILLAVLALAGAFAARQIVQQYVGPLAVAVTDDTVIVVAPGVLYRLDATGHLLGTDRELIDPAARDAGLSRIDGELLVSPGRDGKLMRCNGDGTACAPFSNDPWAPTGSVQAATDPDGRLWLLETEADRAHRFFADGRRIDMPLSDLKRPGDLRQQGEWLFVCNTDARVFERRQMHRRGVSDPEEPVTRFSAGDDAENPVDRPLRMLPHGDGGFRLILTDRRHRHGRLVDVDAAGSVQSVKIDGLVNPVSLAALDDSTLIVDEDRMQVLQLDAQGKTAVFGDAEFRQALDTGVADRDLLRITYPLLLVLATLLAAIGGSWLLQILLSRGEDPALALKPGADGILWLPEANARAAQNTLTHVIVALPLAVLPVLLAARFEGTLIGLGWAVAVLVLAAQRAQRAVGGSSRQRVGLRGEKVLLVADPEQGLNEYRLAQVQWSDEELRPAANLVVPLAREGRDLFHRPTLEKALFPLLDPARKLAEEETPAT